MMVCPHCYNPLSSREVGSLREENAKLRDEFRKMDEWHSKELVAAINENSKLRELVRHMGACIQHLDRTDEDGGCVRCPYQTVEHDCGFEQRMAELGIEVGA